MRGHFFAIQNPVFMIPMPLVRKGTYRQCQIASLRTFHEFLFHSWTWMSRHTSVFFLPTEACMSSIFSNIPASQWYDLWNRRYILPKELETVLLSEMGLLEWGILLDSCHSRVRHPRWGPLFPGFHFFFFPGLLPHFVGELPQGTFLVRVQSR